MVDETQMELRRGNTSNTQIFSIIGHVLKPDIYMVVLPICIDQTTKHVAFGKSS